MSFDTICLFLISANLVAAVVVCVTGAPRAIAGLNVLLAGVLALSLWAPA